MYVVIGSNWYVVCNELENQEFGEVLKILYTPNNNVAFCCEDKLYDVNGELITNVIDVTEEYLGDSH